MADSTLRTGRSAVYVVSAFLLALVAAELVACAGLISRSDVAPQEWWKKRGPVVPHDSFPADCSLCHTGDGWHSIRADFQFDHGAETGVVLAGAHKDAECLRCHNDRGPVARYASRGCAGCHEDVHRAQLGKECSACHVEDDWRPRGEIARHTRTRFPLVGAHATVPCRRCHEGAEVGQFTRVDVDCAGCHEDDLARATDPDHVANGWIADCQRCHIPTTWTGAGFNHPGSFPLIGGHALGDCSACHSGGGFGGAPTDCVACHLADYTGTTDPDHVAQGFPTDCQLCHTVFTWDDATFTHSGITSGCVDCHLDDYLGATNPNHVTNGFPQACEICHTTRAWQGADFDHPTAIDRGNHTSLDCTDCHLNPRDFNDFSCTHCHEHSRSEMADEHDRVPGYVWQSNACFACHPDGNE